MHDQSLEQKLRSALQAEGDGIAFTITTAELERRLALRRRGGTSRLGSLGLAAAVTVGLLGLAGVAGGWFTDRALPPAATATPTTPVVTTAPSVPGPVASWADLDAMIAGLDPARVVRMVSVGPFGSAGAQAGVDGEPIDSGSMTLAPMTEAGAYRVWTSCSGDSPITLDVLTRSARPGAESIQLTCDRETTVREVGLEAGDALRVTHGRGVGWRLVVEAPAAMTAQPLAYEPIGPPDDGWTELARAEDSVTDPAIHAPTYDDPPGGHDVIVQFNGSAFPGRDEYEILVSCAGPGPVRSYLGATQPDIERTGTFGDYVSSGSLCDGRVHRELLDVPLPSGAQLHVTASQRTVFSVVVRAKTPPIALAEDRDGWQMKIGTGPDLHYDTAETAISDMLDSGPEHQINVVVTCQGGSRVDVTVYPKTIEDDPLGTIEGSCAVDQPITTELLVLLPGDTFLVVTKPDAKMWLAVTVQERDAVYEATPTP